jgi:hypothetical protein
MNKEEIMEAIDSARFPNEFDIDEATNEVYNLLEKHNENLLMDFLFYLATENRLSDLEFMFRTEVNKFLNKD